MSIPYAKPSDCIDVIPALTVSKPESAELEAALRQSLLDASRMFETEVMAPTDYFAAAGADFSVRKFYGNGTSYLRLNPYTEIEYVHDPEDELIDAEDYIAATSNVYEPTGYYIKWLTSICGHTNWILDPITVSAKWGFPCIPPDVTVAVKNMGCLMFLTNSQSRLGLNTDNLSQEQEARLRNTYNRIMQRWQDKFRHVQLGV